MKHILSALFVLVTATSFGQVKLSSTFGTSAANPLVTAIGVPLDARSYYCDTTNYKPLKKWYAFDSYAQATAWLTDAQKLPGVEQFIDSTFTSRANGVKVGGKAVRYTYNANKVLVLASSLSVPNVQAFFLGNSNTKGYTTDGSINVAQDNYVTQLQVLMAGSGYALFANLGVPGAKLTTANSSIQSILTQQVPQLQSAMQPNNYEYILVVLEGGINNLHVTPGQTAAQAYAEMVTLCKAIKALSPKIILLVQTTPPSYDNTGVDVAYVETQRVLFNALIRARWRDELGASLFVDHAVNTLLDVYSTPFSTTYYQADGIHFKRAGYGALAADIVPALNAFAARNGFGYVTVATASGGSASPTVQTTQFVEDAETDTSKIFFSGNWQSVNDSANSGGTAKYLASTDTGSIIFKGRFKQFRLWASASASEVTHRAGGRITIDGNPAYTFTQAVQNPTGSPISWPYYTSPALLDGYHIVRITFPAKGSINPIFDKVEYSQNSYSYQENRTSENYEDSETDTSKIVFSSAWQNVSDSNNSGGTAKYLDNQSGTVTIKGYFSQFRLWNPVGPSQVANRGAGTIAIDGGTAVAFSQVFLNPANTDESYPYYTSDILPYGYHTVVLSFSVVAFKYPLFDKVELLSTEGNYFKTNGQKLYTTGYQLGLGTNNPTALLDINGTLRLRSNGAGSFNVLTSDANGNATWQTLPLQSTYPTTSTPTPAAGFAIVWFDGTNLKVIKNVGGTTTTLVIF